MLKQLSAKKFTVFNELNVTFAKGINVVVGTNGAGKSHLLKLAYTAARWSQEMALREKNETRPDKATLQKELGRKLTNVFRIEDVGRLSSRGQGVHRTKVCVTFHKASKSAVDFSFSTRSTTDAVLDRVPEVFFSGESVFVPTKEMLTMFPGFTSLYREREIQIDETYYDLCLALEKPLKRRRKLADETPLLERVEEILGGSIQVENGRFYLSQPGRGKFEIPLVAEGFRKLGTLAYLLANGTLNEQSILFWDEPETNLNPAYLVKLAELLVQVAKHDTQVILATHSLFLLRELSLQMSLPKNKSTEHRFFALKQTEAGEPSTVTAGDSAEEIEPIAALDAEIEQSQRYLDAAHATEAT